MKPSRFIPFNKPTLVGNEMEYLQEAVSSGHISSDGIFSAKCESFFQSAYGVPTPLLTTSCTDALELAALLLDVRPGDEIIMPSFAYVSIANAFALRGAKIVFADSCENHPNIDVEKIGEMISSRTKAIVCLHYAGMSCDMKNLLSLSAQHNIPLVEDAAHAIGSKWENQKQLGTIGAFGAVSFHETKNIFSGEGGVLFVNDASYSERAGIVSRKGTNREAFSKGKTPCYEWVDTGSSFRPSELSAAFLFAQLENVNPVIEKRKSIWLRYYNNLAGLARDEKLILPDIPRGAETNGHIFYVVCRSAEERSRLINYLENSGIKAVFHYQALHRSPFYLKSNTAGSLPNAEKYSDCLLRLPLFYTLTPGEVDFVSDRVHDFFH